MRSPIRYLAPLGAALVLACSWLPSATRAAVPTPPPVAPLLQPLVPGLARLPTIPVYLPSWLPIFGRPVYPSLLSVNKNGWQVQLISDPNCTALYCVGWFAQGVAGVHLRQHPDRTVNLGANGVGHLFLNKGSNSTPDIEWTRNGNTYITVATTIEASPDQPTLVHIARSMVLVSPVTASPATSPTATPAVTATPAPAGTPTDVPSPAAPPPGLLYQANWLSGIGPWTAPGGGRPHGWSINNGMLFYDGSGQQTIIPPYNPGKQGHAAYAVQAQIRMVRGIIPGQQIFGGDMMVNGSNGSTGYAWTVFNSRTTDNNGDPCLAGLDGKGCIGLSYTTRSVGTGDLGEHSFAYGYGWHTYRMEVKDNHIRLLVDGKMVVKIADYRYWSGGYPDLTSDHTQILVRSFQIIAL